MKKQTYLSELDLVQSQINYFTALLNEADKFDDIQISFKTTKPLTFHTLSQDDFGFSLQYELVKLFNDHLDFLMMIKENILSSMAWQNTVNNLNNHNTLIKYNKPDEKN